MAARETPRERRLAGRRLCMLSAGCLLALALPAGAVLALAWYLSAPPSYTVAAPKLPRENAFDYVIRARQAMRHREHLRSAEWDTATHRLRWPRPRAGFPVPPMTPTVVRPAFPRMLRDNDASLQLIRKALDCPLVLPVVRSDGGFYGAAGDCRYLLRLNSLYQQQERRWRQAASSWEEYVRLQVLLGQEPPLIPTHLADVLGHLPPAEAQGIVRRLGAVLASCPTLADATRRQKPALVSMMVDGVLAAEEKAGLARWRLGFISMYPSPMAQRSAWMNQWCVWTVPDRQVPALTERYLDACIAAASRPFSDRPAYPRCPRDVYNHSMFGFDTWELRHLGWTFGAFQQQCDLLAMALEGYRRERGSYPTNLHALVEAGWLERVPADPFTGRDAIRYVTKAGAYVLYSRGPDGRDDAGAPVGDTVGPRSRGDVVYDTTKRAEPEPAYL